MADHRHLLYTDFDGNPLHTPAPLVGRGLVDDRHLERVPGLATLLDDQTADPSDRLLACLALTAWGEERGYRAVVAAAGAAPPPWRGLPRAPFGLVAAQVGISDAMAERKGTEAARLAALRALVGVAVREDFGDSVIEVDIVRLQADIDAGRVNDVEILPPHRVQAAIQADADRIAARPVDLYVRKGRIPDAARSYGLDAEAKAALRQRMIDMANAQRHHEWMIRGVVPSRYIIGPHPGRSDG